MVNIRADAHDYDWNAKGVADLERGIASWVKIAAKDNIGREVANVTEESPGDHPAIQRPGNERKRRVVKITYADVWRLKGKVQFVIGSAVRQKMRWITGIRIKDLNLRAPGNDPQGLV
jgi:hypothetical protein